MRTISLIRRIEVDGVAASARAPERVLVLTLIDLLILLTFERGGVTRDDAGGTEGRVGDGGARAGVDEGMGAPCIVELERS